MRYLKSIISEGECFFEVDDQLDAVRQILVFKTGGYLSSNRDSFLSDQAIDYQDSCYLSITQIEFEKVWTNYLNTLNKEWNSVKASLSIGMQVEGFIEMFYPHGIIVNLFNNHAFGVIDYDYCRATTPAKWLYPRHLLTSRIKGYDEVNYWIILEQAEIFADEYSNEMYNLINKIQE